jgi:mono/diheme cytochrome c family protein
MPRRRALAGPLVLLALAAGCGGGSSGSSTPAGSGGATPTSGDAAAGKTVFTSTADPSCGGCHTLADAGSNGTVGPDLDDLKPDFATVQNQVENGGGSMPSFKGKLTDTQIADVAAYVSSVAGNS